MNAEPDVRDLLFMWDGGQGAAAVGIYKDGIVRVGVGNESFFLPARAFFDMLKFYAAAGFKLESPRPEMLDAQRYRYLRDVAGQIDGEWDGPMVCQGLGDFFEYLRGASVDEAVDEAIAEVHARGTENAKP